MEPEQTPDYDQLLEQIHRLPQNDFERLVQTLSHEIQSNKSDSGKSIQSLLLKAPTWSNEQWEAYQGNLSHFRQH